MPRKSCARRLENLVADNCVRVAVNGHDFGRLLRPFLFHEVIPWVMKRGRFYGKFWGDKTVEASMLITLKYRILHLAQAEGDSKIDMDVHFTGQAQAILDSVPASQYATTTRGFDTDEDRNGFKDWEKHASAWLQVADVPFQS